MSQPIPPKDAFFSGYYTDYAYFRELSLALNPILAEQVAIKGQQYYMTYVGVYDKWKRDLPDDDYDKAPRLKGWFLMPTLLDQSNSYG